MLMPGAIRCRNEEATLTGHGESWRAPTREGAYIEENPGERSGKMNEYVSESHV
jgi:hypothetical protein